MFRLKLVALLLLLQGCVVEPPQTVIPPEANIPPEGDAPARIDYDYVTTPAGADPLPPPNLEDYSVEFQGSYYGDAKVVFGEDLLRYRDYIERYAETIDEEYGLQLTGMTDKRCRTRTFPSIKLASVPAIPKPPNLDLADSDVDEDILIYKYIRKLSEWIEGVKEIEATNKRTVKKAIMDFNAACLEDRRRDRPERKARPPANDKPKPADPPASSTPPPAPKAGTKPSKR